MYKIESVKDLESNKSLVTPVGYRLLVAMPQVEEKTEGGVYLTDELVNRESTASIIGCVVAMGPDSYKDEEKFPHGPYCQVGDWVVFRPYSGTKIKLDNGLEVRIINDDTVEGVVGDPRRIKRA